MMAKVPPVVCPLGIDRAGRHCGVSRESIIIDPEVTASAGADGAIQRPPTSTGVPRIASSHRATAKMWAAVPTFCLHVIRAMIVDHGVDLHKRSQRGQDLNLRPLGYERGESGPDGRWWTRLDGQTCRSQGSGVRRGPPTFGSVRRSLPTFCLHVWPSEPPLESNVVGLNVVIHLGELGPTALGFRS